MYVDKSMLFLFTAAATVSKPPEEEEEEEEVIVPVPLDPVGPQLPAVQQHLPSPAEGRSNYYLVVRFFILTSLNNF